jgi:hypothetical protein
LSDVVGKAGTVAPAHTVSEAPNANVGGMFGVTVTVNVVGITHPPEVGVNVYVPEFWLSTIAGLHVPVIALSDVTGNVGTAAPAHIVSEVPKPNVGVMFGFTVTVNVVVVAHNPAVGVKV